MATNIRQHESFDKGLEDLKRYADEVATEPATYEGARVRGIIDSFAPDLVGHLRDEIGTLLALERFGAGELLEAYKELEKHAVDSVDMVCTVSNPILKEKAGAVPAVFNRDSNVGSMLFCRWLWGVMMVRLRAGSIVGRLSRFSFRIWRIGFLGGDIGARGDFVRVRCIVSRESWNLDLKRRPAVDEGGVMQ